MEEIVFLHIFRIFKLIKKVIFHVSASSDRTSLKSNSAAAVEFSSSEVGNSVADFTVHLEKKKKKFGKYGF